MSDSVNFQRRNQGRLADLPDFAEQGQSAYVDYAAATGEGLPSVMREAVAEADAAPVDAAPVAPPAGAQTPEAMAQYEAAQRAFLDRAKIAAERQAKAAGNPLNVVGGVLGTPIKLLGNILGGQNDLTSAFTPKQNAQDRLAQKLADISTAKLGLAQKMDGYQSSLTKAMTEALTNRSELMGQTYDIAANLAQNAKGAANPQAVYAQGLANLMQDPLYGPVAKSIGLDQMAYSPDLARSLARGKDVTSRLDETGGVKFGSISENGTGVLYNPDGTIKQLIQYGDSGPAGAPPPVSPNPTPNPTPELPPLDAIDAEIKRRIEAQATDGVTMPQPPPSPGQQPQQLISAEDYARMETALGPQGVQSWMRANNITLN